MNHLLSIILTVFILCPVLWGADLGPYQLILDKQLLGIEKAVPSTVEKAPVVAAAPSWSREYRMTMITQDEDKLRVGLQSLKDQSSFLLIEGEEASPESSFQLVSGDYTQGTAVIRYRGSESRFQIEAGQPPKAAAPVTSSGRGGRGGSPRAGSPRNSSFRAGRSVTPKPEPTPKPQVREFKTREELQAHLQEQQMDAVRTGKPLLPIVLTPENDTKLVKEGLLPPL